MASQPQQAPPRTWLRLPSIARPAPPQAVTPAPEQPAPPRPALAVPSFRPTTQPQPPQAREAVTAPPLPTTAGAASLPTSPVRTSVPSSPVRPRAPGLTSSVPSSPFRPQVPGPSSVPSSPTPKPALSSTATSPSAPKPTPTVEPPRTIETAKVQNKTPPQTRPKPSTPPPSPLTLPPAQVAKPFGSESEPRIPLEAEQKSVVVQKTVGSERDFTDNVIKSSIASLRKQEHHSKGMEGKEKGHHKKHSSDSDDSGMRIITIAGENRGAFMELIQSPNKKTATTFEGNSHFLHKKKEHKGNGSSSSSSSGDDANPKNKDKAHKLGKAMGSHPMRAFMNSNVQGVNNSIVHNSTCTHHDPGVHLTLSRKPGANGFHIKDHANGFQG